MTLVRNVLPVARDLLDRYGIHAPLVIERKVRESLDGADREGAAFWSDVQKMVAVLRPGRRSSSACSEASQRAFDAAPHAYLMLSPELTIVGANDAYLAATMTRRQDLLGRPLFDAFPDNPGRPEADGVRNLAASLARVLDTGRRDPMDWQRYDIRGPDGVFLERWWQPLNTPVFGEDGRLVLILHHVLDVTAIVEASTQAALRPAPRGRPG